MKSLTIFSESEPLDFESTKESFRYTDWHPDKYWTYEKFWNQNGYDEMVYESQSVLPAKLMERSTLVDLGSGKGHALFSFGIDWNFKKLKGVEITKEYVDICAANFRKIKDVLRNPQGMTLDALTVDFPLLEIEHFSVERFDFSADIHFAFMFNPFGPDTTTRVVENLLKSLDKFPRDFYILYRNANQRNIFLDTGRFEIFYHHKKEKAKYFILKGR